MNIREGWFAFFFIIVFVLGVFIGANTLMTSKADCAVLLGVAHSHQDSVIVRQTVRGDCREKP